MIVFFNSGLLLFALVILPIVDASIPPYLGRGHIFHKHLSEDILLHLLDIAEKELRVFIYPIPDHVERYEDKNPSDWQECEGRTHELHFCIEELFIRYLRDIRDNFPDYPHIKTNFVVNNPEHANAFIIDHTWVMKNSVEKHLRPIINNVVDNYPFYNRSFGHDHFLVYPYDFGVLCSGRYLREDFTDIEDCHYDPQVGHKYFCHVSRILNTSFIGNYGMDSMYFEESDYSFGLNKCIGSCPRVACHRPNIDIVTPQYLTKGTHERFESLARSSSLNVYRPYDSCFSGNYRYQRSILDEMRQDATHRYKFNHTENYKDSNDLLKCIFAYHMCGQACWSRRLYDALALGAVPIIVTDGAIQSFERYIDWRQFSIKISVAELYQDRFTNRFRKHIRRQSDAFRQLINHFFPLAHSLIKAPNNSFINKYSGPINPASKKFGFVLKKMVMARSSVKWFNFRNLTQNVNAFRMIVLEMFCRLVRHEMELFGIKSTKDIKHFRMINRSTLAADKEFQYYVCTRAPDFTARLRYVQ